MKPTVPSEQSFNHFFCWFWWTAVMQINLLFCFYIFPFSCLGENCLQDEWVICRIFYKTGGEKKNPCIKSSSSYFLEASPPPTIYLPPLLDPSTLHSPRQTLSNPHMVLQEYNPSSQNSLHYPATLQPLPSPTNPSILKSLSHQFLLKEPLIPKECKMGNSMFSITNWVDIDHQLLQSHCTHDKCLGAFGLSAAGVAHDMSPSISFDRTGFQMVDAEPWWIWTVDHMMYYNYTFVLTGYYWTYKLLGN